MDEHELPSRKSSNEPSCIELRSKLLAVTESAEFVFGFSPFSLSISSWHDVKPIKDKNKIAVINFKFFMILNFGLFFCDFFIAFLLVRQSIFSLPYPILKFY